MTTTPAGMSPANREGADTVDGRERLRVLFVTGIFPNPEQPELGTFNQELERELRRICDVTVIAPTPWFPSLGLPGIPARWRAIGRIPRRFHVGGADVLSPKFLVVPKLSEPFLAASLSVGMYRTFMRTCAVTKPHVVMALYLYPDGVASAWLARLARIPVVLVGLGTDINRLLGERSKRGQIRSALGRAAGVIVVSRSLKARLVQEGADGEAIAVIPNGVDIRQFRLFEKEDRVRAMGLPVGRRRVLFVGRLAQEKGPLHLIQAFSRLALERADVDLCMVGDGELRTACKTMVARHGLGARVQFAGFQSHDAIASWIGACDVLCLPSLSEGCPNVVLEALACGRPVVASAVGAIPEMVGPTSGILVPAGDDPALSHALGVALGMEWDAETIRMTVSGLSWAAVAGAYCDYLKRVVAGAGSARATPATGSHRWAKTRTR